MRRALFIILIILGLVCIAEAAYKTNPYTGKPDFHDVRGLAPVNPTDGGSPGEIAYDGSYIYVCISANTWVRASLTTWTIIRTPVYWQGIQVNWQGAAVQR